MTDQPMRHPDVEYYEDASGGWRWRLLAVNGEIVATGESHASRRDAQRAFRTAVGVATAVAAAKWADEEWLDQK